MMINKGSIISKLGLILALLLISINTSTEAFAKKDNVFRLVIDPGHGGHNDGTKHGSFKEKDLTLKLAMKVGSLIKKQHPEVRILYTRSRDIFKTLDYRPNFAGRINADLFISIHVNHAPSTAVSGTETFILPHNKEHINIRYISGRSKHRVQQQNRALSLEIASLIEQEYRRLGKSSRGVKEGNLQVLRENPVPAVLTEVGFLSNAKDRRLLCTRSGQNKIAEAISKAFSKYYRRHHKAGARSLKTKQKTSSKQVKETKTTKTTKATLQKGEKGWYRVQFMATGKWINTDDARFKKIGVSIHRSKKENGLYHYTAGNYRTLYSVKKLRDKLRKKYKDCFIVLLNSKGERVEAIY